MSIPAIENPYSIPEQLPNETQVLDLARAGDVTAIGSLYQMHHAKIFNYAWRRTGNPDDAADITHDVFERAIGHLPDFIDSGQGWAPYLTRAIHNTACSQYRRSQIHPTHSFDPTEQTVWLVDTDRPVEERVADASSRDHLVELLRTQIGNENFLEALIETVVNGLTADEYAAQKGIPKATVLSRVHRAKKAVRRAFPEARDLTSALAS